MQDRIDLYAPIHKAYRAFMCDTLLRVGRVDVDDPVEFDDTIDRVTALLTSLRHHARHEDEFLHPLLVRTGQDPASIADHAHHATEIAALEALTAHAASAPLSQRAALMLHLYRRLGAFVAANLEHMLDEEIDNNAGLWAFYTDEQLVAAHNKLLASIEPPVFMEIMSWMLPALTPEELVQVMEGTRANAPPSVFDALLSTASRTLAASRYIALCVRLGLTESSVGEPLRLAA